MFEKKKFFYSISIFSCIFLLWNLKSIYLTKNNSTDHSIQNNNIKNSCSDYRRECLNLFKKLRYPNQSLLFRPPLKQPPANLLNDFIQNGDMPITKEWYINEVYSDSNSNNKNIQENISRANFDGWLQRVKQHSQLNYGNTELQTIMTKYKNEIADKSVVVIGTQLPWIEAISYHLSASKITTLDYTRKKYETERLKWLLWFKLFKSDFVKLNIRIKEIFTFQILLL